ncbi:MAG: ABC transporter permease [Alsobacter sp.]
MALSAMVAVLAGATALHLVALLGAGFENQAGWGYAAALATVWLAAWHTVDLLIRAAPRDGLGRMLAAAAVPILFGLTVLFLWECGVRGFGSSMMKVILPAPSAIAGRFAASLPVLGADFAQTFKGVAVGYLIGCGAGILVAVLIDRSPFLQQGLLPLGNLVSALPIVGVAPIMVMWFGFDWQSKAAIVVIMTFFPQLVNTVAGLASAGPMERDLMKTYAASYGQTLAALRLPAALPFIFNGLKINSTLALIGAIVAEFFGTPIVGMGFRINTEVGRMNIDMVWATILVAALFGSLFYGLLALAERRATFWHASYRQRAA